MAAPDSTTRGPEAAAVRRHALGWLLAANAVGALLATELLYPAFGDALAPLSYGRWVPLHLDWQLYGWCALPLAGVLLRACLDPAHPRAAAHARVALGAWTLALAAGGAAWLGGVVSGKLFLDWSGWARGLLPLAMIVLWTVLAAHAWWRRREAGAGARAVLVAAMSPVPSLLYWAAGRAVHPPVNPDSGGATGASLLGSTLGIVLIYGLLPNLLGLARRKERANGKGGWWFGAALAVSWAIYAAIDHGAASHHAPAQIAGLGVLIFWIPGLAARWRGWNWTPAARRWLAAAAAWWALLVASGWFTFLPGISERLKFTNALVAHAHLAMAGLVSAVNLAILNELAPERPILRGFRWWNGACAAMVAVLFALGWGEAAEPGALFRGEAWTQAAYAARLAAGCVLTVVAAGWWAKEMRPGVGNRGAGIRR